MNYMHNCIAIHIAWARRYNVATRFVTIVLLLWKGNRLLNLLQHFRLAAWQTYQLCLELLAAAVMTRVKKQFQPVRTVINSFRNKDKSVPLLSETTTWIRIIVHLVTNTYWIVDHSITRQ